MGPSDRSARSSQVFRWTSLRLLGSRTLAGQLADLPMNHHSSSYPPTTPIQHTTPTSSAAISSFSGAVSTFRSPNIFTISTILFAAPARVISSPSSSRLTSPSALRTG